METEFGLTSGPINTKYAPLAAFALRFRHQGILQPLTWVQSQTGKPDFSIADKLSQILVRMLAGCEYISEVNPRLRSEVDLAHAWGFERYLEQSSLALALNQLNRTHLNQLEQAVRAIWQRHSWALRHDWWGFIGFDVDLSGLPCGKGAQWSQKGYIRGKKTPRGAS
jgi:hypothetical protein